MQNFRNILKINQHYEFIKWVNQSLQYLCMYIDELNSSDGVDYLIIINNLALKFLKYFKWNLKKSADQTINIKIDERLCSKSLV